MTELNCMSLHVGDGHLNLNARLDGDGGDLLHNIRGADQVNHPLVDAELKAIPCVCS